MDAGANIFKARLVTKRFTHENGVDYNYVSSLVVNSTIQLLCVLIVLFGVALNQMDVVSVFLYGTLD